MDIEVIITKQDYDKSSKDYTDIFNCPAATAIKRTLGRDDITVGPGNVEEKGRTRYIIEPYFGFDDFTDLQEGKIQEFKTVLKDVQNIY